MSDKFNSKGKPYNPTLAVLFDAPAFGLDATDDTPEDQVVEITLNNGEKRRKIIGTAFRTKREGLSPNDFAQIQKSVQIGSGMLLRAGSKLNAAGGRNFYLEATPPYQLAQNYDTTKPRVKKTESKDDGGI